MSRTRFFVLAAVLTLFASNITLAGNYIDDAVTTLKRSQHVYVAPGTENTTGNTAASLQKNLTKNDVIVLVMFPASATEQLGMEPPDIAKTLSEKLGDKYIIGLAVGGQVVGYAPSLPNGVAADRMEKANGISYNNPVNALVTFANYMHSWLAENPPPKDSPLSPTKDGGTSTAAIIMVAFAAAVAVTFVYYFFFGGKTDDSNRTKFEAPDQIEGLLNKIAKQRLQTTDAGLRGTLLQLCEVLEKHFKASTGDKNHEINTMTQRLTEVTTVMVDYLKMQKDPILYRDPERRMKRARESIADYTQSVISSIQQGNDIALIQFDTRTNRLEAERYR